jgi:antitoxin component YwqK of YwqJK toxin-antitoxin module
MSRFGNVRGAIGWAALLLVCLAGGSLSAEDEVPGELPPAAGINPLRAGSVPKSKSAGRWVEWRGGAQWEGEYHDGKRHGIWECSVAVTDDSHFKESDYEGFESPFTIRVEFDQNVPHGEISGIDAQQRPVFAWHFEQGVLEGRAAWWHPTGQSRRQVTYRAGLLDGPLTEWDADGKVVLQETYLEGRGSRARIEWHQPGRKHYEGYTYLPGEVARDTFDWQSLSWSQTAVHEYFSEERCGRWTAWYPNGQKKLQGSYQDGEADGRFTWWHPNGQKMAEGEYQSGKRHGPWRFWHSNGHKHLLGDYEYGQAEGPWQAWTADGRPAVFDRTQAVLVLDWDESTDDTQTAKRAAPSRPTRSDVAGGASSGQPSAARTTKPAETKPSAKSIMTNPKPSRSATPASGQANAGIFPGLLPGPASNESHAPAATQGNSDEFTLLGLFVPSKKPCRSVPRAAREEPNGAETDSASSDAAFRDPVAELLGLGNKPQARRPPQKPIRR